MAKVKIAGLDPSYRNWGIATGVADTSDGLLTVTELHTVHTEAQPKGGRIRASTWDIQCAYQLFEGIYPYIQDADIVCVEVPTGAQNAKGAIGHGICLGILGTMLSNKLVFVTPQSVKKILGNPKATKKDSVMWASTTHPEAAWPVYKGKINVGASEHSADAIAAIYAAAQTNEFKSLIKELKDANPNQKTA